MTGASMTDKIFKSNPKLELLEVFVGEWEMEASGNGVALARARTKFEWQENHAFIIHHSEAEPPLSTTPQIWIDNNPNPLIAIIGYDDDSGLYSFLYADARGVRRVYLMSLVNETWKIWGKAGAQFYQRFEGKFSNDNNLIVGKWERSVDGENWEVDFDVKYSRKTK